MTEIFVFLAFQSPRAKKNDVVLLHLKFESREKFSCTFLCIECCKVVMKGKNRL